MISSTEPLTERERALLQTITALVEQMGGEARISDEQMETAQENKPTLTTYYDPFIPGFVYQADVKSAAKASVEALEGE